MERFFVTMSETWADFDLSDQTFLAATPELAVVLTNVHARARATGQEVDFPILQIVRFEGGRIVEVRPFYWDTAALATVLGPE